jgi:hypothetical protein
MKTKSLKVISLVIAGLVMLGFQVYAQQGAQGTDSRTSRPPLDGTAITKEEAQKKYPAAGGNYPLGNRDPHDPSGIVASPYPPYQKYNCSKINHGGLVLDSRVKKVFVYP